VAAGPAWGRIKRLRAIAAADGGSGGGMRFVERATAGTAIDVIGLHSLPNAGDDFIVTSDPRIARASAEAFARIHASKYVACIAISSCGRNEQVAYQFPCVCVRV